MDKREILATPYGEMLDMISCLSVYQGSVRVKKKKKKMSFEEVMALR